MADPARLDALTDRQYFDRVEILGRLRSVETGGLTKHERHLAAALVAEREARERAEAERDQAREQHTQWFQEAHALSADLRRRGSTVERLREALRRLERVAEIVVERRKVAKPPASGTEIDAERMLAVIREALAGVEEAT